MFSLEQFITDCRSAVSTGEPGESVREVIARAVSDPAAVLAELGEPKAGMIQTLYHSDDLTILNAIWAPYMTLTPHDHRMWAVIGVYSGREDNIFWRRAQDGTGKLKAVGAKALSVRDAEPLARDVIHSVTNPIPRLTAAIHAYGGDFFSKPRSEWDPDTLTEHRWEAERAMRRFEEANKILSVV